MEKEERAEVYYTKSIHSRKEKKGRSRKEVHLLSKELREEIRKMDLEAIITFMNERYDQIIKEQKEAELELKVSISNRVEHLKAILKNYKQS
jgi:hypothetical protein